MAGSILYVEGGQKYKVNSVVARGGMGVVCEATDLSCRRAVAIKVLPRNHSIPPDEQERFIEEAQITSQLEHPNIVPVHELGYDAQHNVFYSMKYIQGRTLTDILLALRKNDPDTVEQFPLHRLLNIFQKVCDAIAFAHSKGVVHCDLKPDNIMICDFGEVVVMDWGLARHIGSSYAGDSWRPAVESAEIKVPGPQDTQPLVPALEGLGAGSRTTKGRVLGTPGFMAPERIMDGSIVDVRSDIYSLGATLYSLLALRAPVTTRDMKEALQRILDGDFLPPVAYNDPARADALTPPQFAHCPDGVIPTALSDMVMKAMSVSPLDRFASIKDFQQEIEAYQNGLIWHLVVDEDFSQDFLSRWELVGGQYFIKDGELHIHGGEPQLLLFKKDLPGDVRIEFDCRQDIMYLNDVSCFLSAIRTDNYHEIPSSGYEFKFGAYDNSLNLLMRADRRIACMVASPLVRNKVYHVRAERMGNRLRLMVNNEEILKVTDKDQLSGADRTAVGLEGWRAETIYSRIRIYCLGTPWKSDILDLAERQIQKGNYTLATALFQEAMDSFPDAGRMERARKGCEMARRRENMMNSLPAWREKLKSAWPTATFQLRMNNDGLTLDISSQGIDDLSPIKDLPLNAVYCSYN
ncbi:MAG: serine/threonine-protein kinase, partial [Lentisphaerota bacterium]